MRRMLGRPLDHHEVRHAVDFLDGGVGDAQVAGEFVGNGEAPKAGLPTSGVSAVTGVCWLV
jgi:hypothetical protein